MNIDNQNEIKNSNDTLDLKRLDSKFRKAFYL
jgi:hypothetical protein